MKFILMISTLLLFSCTKDNSCQECIGRDIAATVVWTGDVAADGCDWCILTDSVHVYHPDALDTAFLHDSLAVTVSYELTGEEFVCGWGANLPVMHITEIKK